MLPSVSLIARKVFLLVCCAIRFALAFAQDIGTVPAINKFDPTDRILSFHSDISIDKNGTIEVIEYITIFNGNGQQENNDLMVPSRNDDIQRGIVRDFPTRYTDSNGLWHSTGFKVMKVLKNGEAEPYQKESLDNGTRLLIGREDLVIPPGIYTYRIEYTTKRQLIYHTGKDEFYWNVNGNGWIFSADTISCRISFPAGARIMEYDCYTGLKDATGKDCRASLEDDHTIRFITTKTMDAYEGLTIAASIQKGVFRSPGKTEIFIRLLLENYILPLLLLLIIALFLFYYSAWKRKGKDPGRGTIFPQFEPPAGLAPADTGYILKQKFSTGLFAATLVDAAVHRALEIEVSEKGRLIKHPLYQFNSPSNLGGNSHWDDPSKYGFSISSIYGQQAEKGKYNSKLNEIQTSLQKTLKKRFQQGNKNDEDNNVMFRLNQGYIWLGTFILIAAFGLSIFFVTTHYSGFILFSVITLLLILGAIHIFFAMIMSAYTPEGRKITDHILGFKMYLETAEQKFYDRLTPPEKTLELFEKYLPYAIALGVENEWARKFETQINHAIEEGYQPSYYHTAGGFGRGFGMNDLSRGISSGLSSTISSASTPPSSSGGGSAGGGRSGGGGGGGGGGGW